MRESEERLPKGKHDFIKHELLLKEIKGIKKELAMLRTRQEFVEDSILSADDVRALRLAREDLRNKRTISLSNVKRRLDL